MEATMQSNSQTETFEQFMASMKKLREKSKEIDQQMQETDRQMQESSRRLDIQLANQTANIEKMIAENNRRMGDLSNSFGELAEHLVAPNLVEKFRDLGYAVDKTSRDIEIKNFENTKMLTEIDILLENGEIAIVVEVKSKLREKHLEEFLIKMEKVRWHADRRQDRRKYIGAIASPIISDEYKAKILADGIYVIEQSGDTMQITAPDGFVPREW